MVQHIHLKILVQDFQLASEEYLSSSNEKYNVLVSTSGDTGSAIASAFHNIPNIEVTILYPKIELVKNYK